MVRVVVADDQDVVRAGLSRILEGEPDLEVVAQSSDGEAAVRDVLRTSRRRVPDGHPDAGARRPGRDSPTLRGRLRGAGSSS